MAHDFNYVLVHERRVIFDAWVDRDDQYPAETAKKLVAPFRDDYPGAKLYVRLGTEYEDEETARS